MPIRWDAVQNEKLLLLAAENGMIDATKLAAAWVAKYKDGLTASAVSQHLHKMIKKAGNGNSTPAGGAARTPAKRIMNSKASAGTPETPSSGTKRKKYASEEDDTEVEADMKFDGAVTPRSRSSRCSRTPKRYEEPENSEEGGRDGEARQLSATAPDSMSDVSDFQPDPFS